MADYLQVWRPEGIRTVGLEGERVTIGRAPENDVCLGWDPRASRFHAVLERLPAGWSIRDLGSANGTFVNGRRIWGERVLAPGDELLVGRTRLVFQAERGADAETTAAGEGLPELTPRERDVLLALCRPAASGEVFTEPASVREIARELYVSEAAVKQHLLRLYEKFGIEGTGDRRRVRLANEAVRRGAVVPAELRGRGGRPGGR